MSTMIDKLTKNHTISKKAHEELVAMRHLDEDITNISNESELLTTNQIVTILNNNEIKIENTSEKIHIIIGIIDNLCHKIVYHKHHELDYNSIKKYVINIIKNKII